MNSVITYGVYTDSDTGVLRGHHWPEVKLDGVSTLDLGEDGIVQAKSYWFKCNARREAERRAKKLQASTPWSVIRRA